MTNEEFFRRLARLQMGARQLDALVFPDDGDPLADELEDALANAEWGIGELHSLASRFAQALLKEEES